MYTYENIFKRFLMLAYLNSRPQNGHEFFVNVMKTIVENEMFTDSLDPSDVVRQNLIYFMLEYECNDIWR